MSKYVHLVAKSIDNVTMFSFLTSVWKGMEIIELWRQCQWFDRHPNRDNQEKRAYAEERLYRLIGAAHVERDCLGLGIQMNFIDNVDQSVLFL